jgi:hypothetical protein
MIVPKYVSNGEHTFSVDKLDFFESMLYAYGYGMTEKRKDWELDERLSYSKRVIRQLKKEITAQYHDFRGYPMIEMFINDANGEFRIFEWFFLKKCNGEPQPTIENYEPLPFDFKTHKQ